MCHCFEAMVNTELFLTAFLISLAVGLSCSGSCGKQYSEH